MEGLLLFVFLVVLVVCWRVLSQRVEALKRGIETAAADRVEPKDIAGLLGRVTRLEDAVAEFRRERAGVAAGQPQAEARHEAKPAPRPTAERAPEPVAVTAPPAIAEPPRASEPAFESTVSPVPPPRPPSLVREAQAPEPARPSRTSAEWEALVGGNLLNKLGILVLVIGIALFLGHSFTAMGPAGRSATGLAVSVALLAAGVLMERRAPYVIFARGLIAGGWAGLYFTTYAMQALDAAKVIHNPLAGGILLLAVAMGMVGHSLRYRVQALTGLSYAVSFATLAITPITTLSVVALIPLAGSLLVVAQRFRWSGMALFGVAAAYATCASRGDSGAPLWLAQTVFATYWMLFEAYDLLRARQRSNDGPEQAILALNALGFGVLSYAKWSAAAPAEVYLLAAGVAAAYLASTILRALLRPPSSFPAGTGTLERILAGGYEGPITLAAACSAAAAALKLHGQTVNNVLLAEGELLFLAGLLFRQEYPRRLAATLFGALGLKLLFTDIPDAGTVRLAGRALQDWTPAAALATLLFYLNRGLRRSGRSYGYAALAVATLIVGFEVPLRFLGISWLAFGAFLFLFGWRFRLFDFRLQGYMAGALAVWAIVAQQIRIAGGTAVPWSHAWLSLALTVPVAYVAALCALRSGAGRLREPERQALETNASAAASAAAAALLWKVVPAGYLGPAWIVLAMVVLELGLRRLPPDFRRHAHLLAALGGMHVLAFGVLPFEANHLRPERIAIGCAALLAYGYAARMFQTRPEQAEARESRCAVNIASACGSLFALVELRALLDPAALAPAWAVFALALMGAGFRAGLPGLRLQGHMVAAAALARLLVANLDASDRLLTMSAVIGAHYYEWWRQRRRRAQLSDWELQLGRPYLYTAAGLIAALLYLELRPPFIEVGWAMFVLALLITGRVADLWDLRLQSYLLAALTFGRALVLEWASPLSFVGAGERIAAGSAVAACLFIAQLFLPRRESAAGPEREARPFYSLLSTALVTALLFHEVSGSMLTMAWGIEGASLLIAGFPLRDRTLRLSGLALFLVCVGKAFLYDLRELETLYRILSFVVLGAILVAVSWLYTRFRSRIQPYL